MTEVSFNLLLAGTLILTVGIVTTFLKPKYFLEFFVIGFGLIVLGYSIFLSGITSIYLQIFGVSLVFSGSYVIVTALIGIAREHLVFPTRFKLDNS